ncbi:hypothetical protein HYT02_05865 [Candidatus Gottesmanbacteria bacterium]|nr:hypothetical protein [Candidatus Gottesmanbacteria bacterium]
MHFHELSLYLEKLENTTLRNKMVEILSELFKKIDENEIQKICYLLQGRVTPLYDPLEFQISDKLIIEAISQALDIEPNKVVLEFKEKGDLGTAAEALKKQQAAKNFLQI